MDQKPDAVLFERDGTLIHDVAHNADPARVSPMPGAAEALRDLRMHGIRTGVLCNQPGIGRGLLTAEQVAVVNARVEELLGRFGTWQICPHEPEDGCECRTPAPGLVLAACEALHVDPARTVVVGAGVTAALSAGAAPILVPTDATKPDEVERAPVVVPDLRAAMAAIL